MTDELRYEWWLDDEGHPWVRHQCADEEIAWRLPPPWKVDGDRITPSLDCQKCGLHIFIGPDEHVDRLWNWEIKLDILCGSCDGKPIPDPDCESCNGTGVDQERAGYPSVTDDGGWVPGMPNLPKPPVTPYPSVTDEP